MKANPSEQRTAEQKIQRLTEQLTKSPDDITLLEQRADLYYQTGNFGKAINDYQQILKLNPELKKIETKIDLIRTILRYSNTDIYASTNTNMDPWLE